MNLGAADETLAFRETADGLDEAMRTVSAMLNRHGYGTIFFGALESGEASGVENSAAFAKQLSRQVYESIRPQIMPQIEVRSCDGRAVVELTFSGSSSPYAADGVCYLREGCEDRAIPPVELRRRYGYARDSWDRALTALTPDDLSRDTLAAWHKRAQAGRRLKKFGDLSAKKVLKKLGLISQGNLTNAAHYLFGSDSPVTLKLSIYATEEKRTILDYKHMKGNIIDLIDAADTYIKANIRWRTKAAGARQTDIPELPAEAIRAVICNAFAHAQYPAKAEHEIAIHPDKVVITSPGAFPNGYTPDDFVAEDLPSVTRNPLILDTLRLSRDADAAGSGLKHVFALCGEQDIETAFETGEASFSFTFRRPNEAPRLKPLRRTAPETNAAPAAHAADVLALIVETPSISSKAIAEKIGISPRTVQRITVTLKDVGCIERIGGTRGYWQINSTVIPDID